MSFRRVEESKEMVSAASPRSSELTLPAVKAAAALALDESKEQMSDEAAEAAANVGNSAVGTQSHYRAVTTAAQQLVQTFDQSQLHFAETVESVYHQLREVLHRTRHSGPLSRTRIDACVQLLFALAAASPHSALLTPLIHNLVAAVYTTPPPPAATPINSATLATTATYFEQVKLLHRKQQLLFRDLQRISAQVEYFDRNGGGHREALVVAIRKWQIELMRTALLGWRENVRTFTIQRTRMRDLLATWERKGRVRRMRWSIRLWKMSVMRRERRELTPQVEAARAHSADLSQQIDDTERAIEQSQMRLGSLLDEMNEISGQCSSVAEKVRQLQDKIERYACFRLSDVAHSVLELAREMMLSLQDELEFGRDVYRYDPYRMLAASVAGEGKKGGGGTKGGGKRGKDSKKRKEKSQREREEEEEKERRLLLSLDTHKYEQRFNDMSEQDLLLLWLNYHIQRNIRRNGLDPQATRSKYNVENFTTDTRDSLALLVLCEEITPKSYLRPQLLEVREELDSEQRARLLLAIVHDFDADAAGVLSGEVVVHASGSDMVGCFVGKLFCHWFGVDSVKGVVEEQLSGLSALRREWEAMTTRVHKLKQKMREREMVYKKQRQHIYNERKHNHDATDDVNSALDDTSSPDAITTTTDTTNPTINTDSNLGAPTHSDAIVEGSQFLDQLPPDEATQYTRYAERFLVSFLRLYRDARYTLDRLKHGHDTYMTLQSRIQRYTLNLLVQRYQGKPAILINYKEKRDRETMCTVHVGHFVDIGMTEEDKDGLQLELTAQFSELRKVFRYYSSNEWEHGSSLSLKDVMQLCTDCKLTAGTITTKSTASTASSSTSAAQLALKGGYEAIFNQCALPVDNHRGTTTSSASTSTDSSTTGSGTEATDETMEITPAAFIELLIRIAYNKYKSTDNNSSSSSSATTASPNAGPAVSLAEKLSMLLRHYVLKNARKLDSEGFRVRYGNGEFSEMLRRHKKKVKKVFEVCAQKTYLRDNNLPTTTATTSTANSSAAAGGGDGSVVDELSELAAQSTSSLSVAVEVSQLLHILRGVKIVGGEGGMTLDEFYTCVSHCRKSDFITAPGIIGPLEELRMEYGEFVELLIAIACYRYPDPYTPLVQRVDNFLGRELNIVFK